MYLIQLFYNLDKLDFLRINLSHGKIDEGQCLMTYILEAVSDNGFHVGDNAAVGIYFWIWIKFFNFRISVFFFSLFPLLRKKNFIVSNITVFKSLEDRREMRQNKGASQVNLDVKIEVTTQDRQLWQVSVKLEGEIGGAISKGWAESSLVGIGSTFT